MAHTAAHVAGWGFSQSRRTMLPSAIPGPMNPAGKVFDNGPGNETGLTVEIFVNNAWTDITPYVYYRNMVHISRGRQDETSQSQPQTCTMTINNRDGRFSPRNPTGPYYGQIGRNTPIRVSRLQNGVRRYRFYGEVPSWPTNWDISGTDIYVDITASGQLRRLSQGSVPIPSVMYRTYTIPGNAVVGVDAYWPCEDGVNSTRIASGLPNGTAMSVTGTPTFASNSNFACSKPIPVINGSTWTGAVSSTTTNDNVTRFLLQVPSGGTTNSAVIARMLTTGYVARMDLVYSTVAGGSLSANCYNAGGGLVFDVSFVTSGTLPTNINGKLLHVSMSLIAQASNIIVSVESQAVGDTSVAFGQGTLSSVPRGSVYSVIINPNGTLADTTALGHISVHPTWDSLADLQNQLNAWIGEGPSARFGRLTAEQGVQGAVVAASGVNGSDAVTMGYQFNNTFTTLTQEPADSSSGMLFESRDQGALILRERGSLYNQSAVLTLDYSQHQLSEPPIPVDDDAFTRNDVTVQRTGGSSSTQTLPSGVLSTQPFPNGVGDYPTVYTLSLGTDSLTNDVAGWRLHLGTVDEPRYPEISINLRHVTFTGSVDLMNAALTIDMGDRLVISNPPAWLPPDSITQIVQGYKETIGVFEHDITFNCSPESPYHIALLNDATLSRSDTDGSTLSAPAAASDTSISVATPNGSTALWTTDGLDFPFDIAVGGERMTVTNINSDLAGVDGSFESGVAGWSDIVNATITSDATNFYSGTKSGLLTVTATAGGFAQVLTSVPISANTSYFFSLRVKINSAVIPGAAGDIDWYDASGAFISSSFTPRFYSWSGWAYLNVTATAPSNAAFAHVGLELISLTIGDTVNFDNVVFQPAVGPQKFRVARATNGIVKPQTVGTDVRLWQPMYLSL